MRPQRRIIEASSGDAAPAALFVTIPVAVVCWKPFAKSPFWRTIALIGNEGPASMASVAKPCASSIIAPYFDTRRTRPHHSRGEEAGARGGRRRGRRRCGGGDV